MGEFKATSLAQFIANEIQDQNFVLLRSVIEKTLRVQLRSKSEEEIAELAESLESQVFFELHKTIENLQQNGVEPTLEIDGDEQSSYIRGCNLNVILFLDKIKELSPDQFEKFCVTILDTLGATSRQVGGTGDGGVDFIATDLPISRSDSIALRAGYPVVVGQAKRYAENKQITETDLRKFLGGALVIAEELKMREERFGILTPVIFAFWTTSDFHNDAREFARKSGIWCLGGLAIAQLAIKLKLILPAK